MDPLQGVTPFRPIGAATTRPAARGGGFSVSGGAAPDRSAAVTETSLVGLLALQEAGGDAVQDRKARQRGHDLLAELAALQRDLLAGPPGGAQLQRLADLAGSVPEAADPRLRDIMAAITLRARIEVARYANA